MSKKEALPIIKKLREYAEDINCLMDMIGEKRYLTDYESAYCQPAVNSAFINCNVVVNSHPIKSNWFSCLYGMDMDITEMLSQLTEQYPGLLDCNFNEFSDL